jgi:uncharacterized protein YndB with AHSA1/START domain
MTLQLRRTFNAPRERVFAAWTERDQLEQWMCRDVPEHDARYTALEVRPRGRYVIEIPIPGGLYRGHGEFHEVIPPEKLVFTWAWERIPPKESDNLQTTDSLITVELFAHGETTEMLFTHEQLDTPEDLESHRQGWEGCFQILTMYLDSLRHIQRSVTAV